MQAIGRRLGKAAEILSTIESSVAFQGQPENTFDPLTSPGGFSD
jgi:hypothetical protein